uniref:Peptidase_M50 domain-containing protein n=1 Tax=Ascaris lumbricoides TaxID=6252 RepID=A0A0M3IXL8_ASCLU
MPSAALCNWSTALINVIPVGISPAEWYLILQVIGR